MCSPESPCKEIKPIVLGENDKLTRILSSIANGEYITLEGPAGTGKTVLISRIVVQLISQGKRIALLASTISSLWEIVDKEYLKSYRKSSNVAICTDDDYKSDVPNEIRHVAVEDFLCSPYSLTICEMALIPQVKSYKTITNDIFDLIVIDEVGRISFEEAISVMPMAHSVLWVGDRCQLSPKKGQKSSFFRLNQQESFTHYLLSVTYRLNKRSALQNSILYDLPLVSYSKNDNPPTYGIKTLHQQGGAVCHYYGDSLQSNLEDYINKIFGQYKGVELAILTTSSDYLRKIKRLLSQNIYVTNVIFSTIYDSQGLSIDISLYIVPDNDDGSSWLRDVLIVAMTRSKQHSVIFVRDKKNFDVIEDPRVRRYIKALESDTL